MSGLLGKYSDIDGVLAYNDESAVGSYTAARSAGRNDIKIVGINGSSLGISALDAGHVAAIVQVDAVNQGAQAAAGGIRRADEAGRTAAERRRDAAEAADETEPQLGDLLGRPAHEDQGREPHALIRDRRGRRPQPRLPTCGRAPDVATRASRSLRSNDPAAG